jgi:hypothetical protein
MSNNTNIFDTEAVLGKLVTDADHEQLFTGLVKEGEFTKFAQLENKVNEVFGDKLNPNLEKFASKLSLDRNRLKELFTSGTGTTRK